MAKHYWVILLILGVLLLAGCESFDISKLSDKDLDRISGKVIVCNRPYMRFGSNCCLDKDDNAICDRDERELSDEEKQQESNSSRGSSGSGNIVEIGNVKVIENDTNPELIDEEEPVPEEEPQEESSNLKASIGNARIMVRTTVPSIVERSIKVYNRNNIPAKITLIPQGDLDLITTFDKRVFVLQPGESKDAKFGIRIEDERTYEGSIEVSFEATNRHPAGLLSRITIIAKKNTTQNESIEEEPVLIEGIYPVEESQPEESVEEEEPIILDEEPEEEAIVE